MSGWRWEHTHSTLENLQNLAVDLMSDGVDCDEFRVNPMDWSNCLASLQRHGAHVAVGGPRLAPTFDLFTPMGVVRVVADRDVPHATPGWVALSRRVWSGEAPHMTASIMQTAEGYILRAQVTVVETGDLRHVLSHLPEALMESACKALKPL